eukprot:gene643-360_t
MYVVVRSQAAGNAEDDLCGPDFGFTGLRCTPLHSTHLPAQRSGNDDDDFLFRVQNKAYQRRGSHPLCISCSPSSFPPFFFLFFSFFRFFVISHPLRNTCESRCLADLTLKRKHETSASSPIAKRIWVFCGPSAIAPPVLPQLITHSLYRYIYIYIDPPPSMTQEEHRESARGREDLRDVFSHLIRVGEQYAERRELLQRKRELEERRELLQHPRISAVALALGQENADRHAEPISLRLHALHREQLEHMAQRREELRQREEAAMQEHLTFRPHITPAGRAKNRRDVARIMTKWDSDRSRHAAEQRHNALRQEYEELHATPSISAFAARYGHADRPAGLAIEDYLLLKAEERRQRQFSRVEQQHAALSPSLAPTAPSPIPGVSRRAAACMSRSRSADVRHLCQPRRPPRESTPPPFRPTLCRASSQLAQRRHDGDVFERLYSRSTRPSSGSGSGCGSGRGSAAAAAADAARPFNPAISRTSRRMVDAARRSAGARSSSPGTRLHAEAERRRRERDQRQRSPPAEAAPFRPRVAEKSQLLWRRMAQALAADGETIPRPAEVRERRWAQSQAYQQEQRQRELEQREAQALAECTFQPQITQRGQQAGGAVPLTERQARWALRRSQRLEEQRLLQELDAVAECTFQPRGSSSSATARASGGSSSSVAGLDAFVQRLEEARERQREAQRKLNGSRRSGGGGGGDVAAAAQPTHADPARRREEAEESPHRAMFFWPSTRGEPSANPGNALLAASGWRKDSRSAAGVRLQLPLRTTTKFRDTPPGYNWRESLQWEPPATYLDTNNAVDP